MTRGGTVGLSTLEQAAVLRHLELQRCRIEGESDAQVLELLLCRVATDRIVELNVVEAVVALRYLRTQLRAIADDLLALEERRLQAGLTVTISDAWRALDADSMLLEGVVRRLWDLLCNAH